MYVYDLDYVVLRSRTWTELEKLILGDWSESRGVSRHVPMKCYMTIGSRRQIEAQTKQPGSNELVKYRGMDCTESYQDQTLLSSARILHIACMQKPPSIENERHHKRLDSAKNELTAVAFGNRSKSILHPEAISFPVRCREGLYQGRQRRIPSVPVGESDDASPKHKGCELVSRGNPVQVPRDGEIKVGKVDGEREQRITTSGTCSTCDVNAGIIVVFKHRPGNHIEHAFNV